MTKAQSRLLVFLKTNGRLPEIDEATELYVEESLRSNTQCLITANGPKAFDYRYHELKERAGAWLKTSIGSLVMQGKLTILINNQHCGGR